MVDVGSSAPEFEAYDTNRQKVTLGDVKGKRAVLAFFPAAFTSVCEKEMCTFRDSMAKLNDLDAVVYGVSVDAPFSNKAFAEKNDLNFEILSDYRRDMVRNFEVADDDFVGLPGYTAAKRSVFVLDADGNVKWKWVADSPKQEPDYDEVQKAVSAA